MPASYLMAWEPKGRRWWKQHNRKRYVISCRQLGVKPETKEASYLAANQWWRNVLAELEGLREPHPHADLLAVLQRRQDRAKAHGRRDEADEWAGKKRALEALNEADEVSIVPESYLLSEAAKQRREVARLLGQHDDDPVIAEALYGDDVADGDDVPADKTLGGQVERRLSQLKARVHAGNLTPGSFANSRDCLYHFRDWIGAKNAPAKITADTLEDFHTFLLDKIAARKLDLAGKDGWSRDFAAKVFGQAKSFISYMAGKGLMSLPPNITSKGFKFGSGAKKIVTMTDKEVELLVEKATGQLRLHLLMMLNCGMTQCDIADLLDEEVDWEAGRIIRKRSKTDDQPNTPTVSYKLWPETFDLLRKYRSGKPTVLLTKSGGLWAWEELGQDGKLHGSDNIATNFKRLRQRKDVSIAKSLKVFRKTSATRMEGSKDFRHFRPLFLGHAPDGIGEKHYADHSPAYFDEAVCWLRSQFKFMC